METNDEALLAEVDRALAEVDRARAIPVERLAYCAIRHRGEKVCAMLGWMRAADLERLPFQFVHDNIIIGDMK